MFVQMAMIYKSFHKNSDFKVMYIPQSNEPVSQFSDFLLRILKNKDKDICLVLAFLGSCGNC